MVDGQGRQLLAVNHLVVEGLLTNAAASPANIHLAVPTTALSVLAADIPCAALLAHNQAAAGSRIARQSILLHFHASVVRFHVAVLDSQNVELGLGLSLLFPQCLLNAVDFLHGQAHLRRHILVLELHVPQLLNLPRQDLRRILHRFVAEERLGQLLGAFGKPRAVTPMHALLLRDHLLDDGLEDFGVERLALRVILLQLDQRAATALNLHWVGYVLPGDWLIE